MKTQPKKKAAKSVPAARTGTLAITVHDSDGEPRPKMRVQLLSKSKALGEFLTDADGEVVFSGLGIGQVYFYRLNGDQALEEIEIERVKETIEVEYDGDLAAVSSDDDDEVPETDDKEEEEDLDTTHEELEELD